MKYKFIPNTIVFDESLQITEEEFYSMQIKYKQDLEKILKKIFDFNSVDKMILSSNYEIPPMNDDGNNFYRDSSTLSSDYLYLRNNIHIERLSREELEYIKIRIGNKENLEENFIYKTLDRVIFEDGEKTILGNPISRDIVQSKSIMFEIAYDSKKCKRIEEITFIENYAKELLESLRKAIQPVIGKEISMHVYDGIPELFKVYKPIKNMTI